MYCLEVFLIFMGIKFDILFNFVSEKFRKESLFIEKI